MHAPYNIVLPTCPEDPIFKMLVMWFFSVAVQTLPVPKGSDDRSLYVQLNIWVMAFNLLLPAYPLDGGRILVNLMLLCRMPIKPAAIITVALAVVVAVLLLVWGFVKTAILTIAVSTPEGWPDTCLPDITFTGLSCYVKR